MWIFTIDGFYSVVEHKEDPNILLVRARDMEDLVRCAREMRHPRESISHTPNGDYAYRMTVTRQQWARYLLDATDRLDYTNFKDAVATTLGHTRAELYADVWLTMMELQRG